MDLRLLRDRQDVLELRNVRQLDHWLDKPQRLMRARASNSTMMTAWTRIDSSVRVDAKIARMPAPIKPLIPHSLLEQVDIRVGTIANVEEVPKSRKLVRLHVDFGDHTRVILAGLKQERPDLSVLVGKQALFVVNLEPKPLAGELSEGMLFDLGYADGVTPALAVPESPVPNGTRAG